jgi:hypothetical protein
MEERERMEGRNGMEGMEWNGKEWKGKWEKEVKGRKERTKEDRNNGKEKKECREEGRN